MQVKTPRHPCPSKENPLAESAGQAAAQLKRKNITALVLATW